ncbi:MAG: FIST C-terminal domain-containing protein [Pseudolabrys sp.]|nr:FIST C-terminal domain-containing protein [Pseudolabrys sp.]
MKNVALSYSEKSGWQMEGGASPLRADLVLFFGARDALANPACYDALRARFPGAHILGCSTGGQIRSGDVVDDDVAAIAMQFDKTKIKLACASAENVSQSRACGATIARALAADDLAGVFVLSDGLKVNGSELVRGISEAVPANVTITGGMAGDGAKFETTLVSGDCAPRSHIVAAVGFYGDAIRIGHGSAGGWDEFGPRRRVTRSDGNVLYELDGEPALDLYKRYLGEEAAGLPGTALLFPLRIRSPQSGGDDLVRTILAVDHEARSMTFAGDIPQGWSAQLMRGNFDRLAAGAADAARQAAAGIDETDNGVAILVSCIGRRLLMGQRTTDEVEAAGAELGPRMPRVGFYSYGEISPHGQAGVCQLHNQTMTVTAITEAA